MTSLTWAIAFFPGQIRSDLLALWTREALEAAFLYLGKLQISRPLRLKCICRPCKHSYVGVYIQYHSSNHTFSLFRDQYIVDLRSVYVVGCLSVHSLVWMLPPGCVLFSLHWVMGYLAYMRE